MNCERCGEEDNTTTMSFFNTQTICMKCSKAEREHPDFERAREVETNECLKGNYNFPGIGLPKDLQRR